MAYLFIALVLLALWHYLYENTIAPSIRLHLRFKLFELRDDLRKLKIGRSGEIDDKLFDFMQSSLNKNIQLLPRIDFNMLFTVESKVNQDAKLHARTEKRMALLDACTVGEVATIRDKQYEIIIMALATNSGAWAIYIVPIFVVCALLKRVKDFTHKLVAVPESDFNRIVPPGAYAS